MGTLAKEGLRMRTGAGGTGRSSSGSGRIGRSSVSLIYASGNQQNHNILKRRKKKKKKKKKKKNYKTNNGPQNLESQEESLVLIKSQLTVYQNIKASKKGYNE